MIMSIFIDFCVTITISGTLFSVLFLATKILSKGMSDKCKIGAAITMLLVNSIINGVLSCLLLKAYKVL